jgi:hypothetical protein
MFVSQTAVLHRSCSNRAEYVSTCRFFYNDKVEHGLIARSLIEQTGKNVKGKPVLVIQDTTTFNFDAQYLDTSDPELGKLGANGGKGFFVHPAIVIEQENGNLLGASDLYIWNRKKDIPGKHERVYQKQPIEQKESYRWIAACERSKEVLNQARSILFIADRESDIYEEFARVPDEKSDVLIRCKENRLLHNSKQKLYENVASQNEAGSIKILIREAKKREQRQAELSVKYCKAAIARPKNHAHKDSIPEYIDLYAIEVKEKAHKLPKGQKPVSWILLTTVAVTSLDIALNLIKSYALRWQIELVFGTMKTNGLNLEDSELEDGRALKALAAMAFITALRINQLRLAREDTRQEASIVFNAEQIKLLHVLTPRYEGNTQIQKNPYPKESLAWGVWTIARLGGWKGYSKSESPPGNKTMFEGWKTFNQILFGWSLY